MYVSVEESKINNRVPGPSLALVVGVPFAILILLAGGLLTAIILVLALWRIRKRRWRAYTFQRMTFNEVDDDEDK